MTNYKPAYRQAGDKVGSGRDALSGLNVNCHKTIQPFYNSTNKAIQHEIIQLLFLHTIDCPQQLLLHQAYNPYIF